ncbi:hypothetical protein jhhlp_001802 [Lomentospora prolificans]|uniref:HTH araC/xylS-type domain-containing protein n=1 Tax=Lomentospora prolificans TaxID=41688 RepID=A0A2N3NGY1_9PEZI|nr:hypothetical protein jhhlp_001802 [Lomentospora prolificans]
MATQTYAAPSARWLAIQHRDPSANSAFLYGVTTTRIFCRPTCPSRVARRSNVVFFDGLPDAMLSGFRPCKRCEPCNDRWDRDAQTRTLVDAARKIILAEEARAGHWTVGSIAKELGVSGAHLHRQFKACLGVTPKAFAAGAARSRAVLEACALDVPSAGVSQAASPSMDESVGEWWCLDVDGRIQDGDNRRYGSINESMGTGNDLAHDDDLDLGLLTEMDLLGPWDPDFSSLITTQSKFA